MALLNSEWQVEKKHTFCDPHCRSLCENGSIENTLERIKKPYYPQTPSQDQLDALRYALKDATKTVVDRIFNNTKKELKMEQQFPASIQAAMKCIDSQLSSRAYLVNSLTSLDADDRDYESNAMKLESQINQIDSNLNYYCSEIARLEERIPPQTENMLSTEEAIKRLQGK